MAYLLGEEEKIDTFESLKEILTEDIRIEDDFYLFFSFDLVNSTQYKANTQNKKQWPIIIKTFYSALQQEVNRKYESAKIWKFLGDESLFYYRVEDYKEIYSICGHIYEIQKLVREKIRKVNQGFNEELDIKTTLWSGEVIFPANNDIEKVEKLIEEKGAKYVNIGFGSNDNLDFLGPDIDIGFRVSKFAQRNKIVITAELAYLLLILNKPAKHRRFSEKLRIVGHEKLKGVWKNRAYPIIWYHHNWKNIKDSFEYDDYIENPLVENLRSDKIDELCDIIKVNNFKVYLDKLAEKLSEKKDKRKLRANAL